MCLRDLIKRDLLGDAGPDGATYTGPNGITLTGADGITLTGADGITLTTLSRSDGVWVTYSNS